MAPGGICGRLFRFMGGTAGLASALLLGGAGTGRAQDIDQEREAENPQLSCFQVAREGGLASDTTAAQLCQGARSDIPARCYLRVRDQGFLSDPQALQLCQYASASDDPASCYLQAKSETFLDESRLVQLCRPPIAQFLRMCPYGP